MGRLRGIAVVLYTKNKVGEDEFGAPVYEELPEVVNDVLVGEPEGSDITDTLNLTGKRLAYTLAIPKGDTHISTHAPRVRRDQDTALLI